MKCTDIIFLIWKVEKTPKMYWRTVKNVSIFHLVLRGGLHHPVAHAVPEDDDVGRELVVGLVVAHQGLGEGHRDRVHDLLALLLDGHVGVEPGE